MMPLIFFLSTSGKGGIWRLEWFDYKALLLLLLHDFEIWGSSSSYIIGGCAITIVKKYNTGRKDVKGGEGGGPTLRA